MNDLIEKLGAADEDNYIYLDKDGNAKVCIEILLRWNLLPNKKLALTFNSDDSLGYLRTGICELMEKYPIFSGLHALTCTNVNTSKGQLPKSGRVGTELKTGEVVNFDLDSKDIWLDIQVECSSLSLVIFFEARVNKSLKVSTFMQYLIQIINQILKANQMETRFEISNMDLSKMHIGDSARTAKNLKSSVLGQGNLPSYLKNIEKDSLIHEVFDYLDRAVLAELEKHEEVEMKKNFSQLSTEVEAKMMECSELPIRGLRVEKKKNLVSQIKPRHRRGTQKEMSSNVCSCFIF